MPLLVCITTRTPGSKPGCVTFWTGAARTGPPATPLQQDQQTPDPGRKAGAARTQRPPRPYPKLAILWSGPNIGIGSPHISISRE